MFHMETLKKNIYELKELLGTNNGMVLSGLHLG